MEIKVNDYVRIDGYISKIEHLRTSSSGKTYAQWKQPNGLLVSGNINIIEKTSPRIIDLIEVGDYVNGCRVNFTYKPDDNKVFRIELNVDGLKGHVIHETKHIKSIVTKEQFSQMEYKVD